MNNPYKVLNLSQDATNTDIVKALIPAMKTRKFSNKEITEAQTTLRKPASRLAADFTLPILKSVEATTIESSIKSVEVNLDAFDVNKYNSLNQ